MTSCPCTPPSQIITEEEILQTTSPMSPRISPTGDPQLTQPSTAIPAPVPAPLDDPFWDPSPPDPGPNHVPTESSLTSSNDEQSEASSGSGGTDTDCEDSSEHSHQYTPLERRRVEGAHQISRRPKRESDPVVISLKTVADYEAYVLRRFQTLTVTHWATPRKRQGTNEQLHSSSLGRKRTTASSSDHLMAENRTDPDQAGDSHGLEHEVNNLSLDAERETETRGGYGTDIEWPGSPVWNENWVVDIASDFED